MLAVSGSASEDTPLARGLLEYRDDELVPTVVLLKDLDTMRQAP